MKKLTMHLSRKKRLTKRLRAKGVDEEVINEIVWND